MSVLARLAALLLAVGLVVGGLAVRGLRDDADPGGLAGPDGTPPAAGTVLCSRDLATVCRAVGAEVGLDVELGSAAQLAERSSAADPAAVWLAPRAWVDVVADARTRAGLPALVEGSAPVASTPLLLVGWQERLAVLAGACGVEVEALTWDCVGQHAGDEWTTLGGPAGWGRVRPGHAAPDTGLGLPDTAAVVAGRTGTGFALRDLRDVATTAWLRDLERAVQDHTPAQGRHLTAMVVLGPSAADVAVATGAEVAGAASSSFGTIATVQAQPLTAVELVLVGADCERVAALQERLTGAAAVAALTDAGWTPGTAPAGEPRVASGGALTALRDAWSEAAG